jgi:hypothetical protein
VATLTAEEKLAISPDVNANQPTCALENEIRIWNTRAVLRTVILSDPASKQTDREHVGTLALFRQLIWQGGFHENYSIGCLGGCHPIASSSSFGIGRLLMLLD